ncbi:MAG: transcriptional repressor [Desulfamplus sp.]|nr:transcriptional repressor [Desulfamplus sp.]
MLIHGQEPDQATDHNNDQKIDQKIDQRMEQFKHVCKKSKVKITDQRMEIFREVALNLEHPDAETVLKGVRKRLPTVSLDTVYRTLWMLSDLGLINTLGPSRGRTRFDANLSDHHHFVCNLCGLTRDFYAPELSNINLPGEVKDFGDLEKVQVEVRGICNFCREELRKDETTEGVNYPYGTS